MEKFIPGSLVEIFTGPYDGAIGLLLDSEIRGEKRYSTVQLKTGEVVVIESALHGTPDDLPRELGS